MTALSCGFPCDDGQNILPCTLDPDHEGAHWDGKHWFHDWSELKSDEPIAPVPPEPEPQ